jgi:hypothetical protein
MTDMSRFSYLLNASKPPRYRRENRYDDRLFEEGTVEVIADARLDGLEPIEQQEEK